MSHGNLLCRKTYTTSSAVPSETRDYIGNIEYVNNVITEVQHEQGRYKSIGTNAYRHEYTITDHLGNTRIVYTDANNDGSVALSEILDENHYYAYGMELPGSFINVSGTNYKFNGIERVESFVMDFAFYCGLDPILGRWYQVDPKAELGYNMSPYCGMGNNPINQIDPKGDLPFLAMAIYGVVNVALNDNNINNRGDIFKYFGVGVANGYLSSLSPLTIGKNIGLSVATQIALGTDGVGVGFNATLGYTFKGFNAGVNFGGTFYASATGTGRSVFEGRFGWGLSYTSPKGWKGLQGYAAVGGTTFFSGETSQRTGYISAGYNDGWNYTFDNDILGDGGDRFRTAGNRIRLGNFEVGLNMFTGDPGLKGEDRVIGPGGPNGTYEDLAGNSPNKYRFGGFYLGYRSNRNSQNFYRVGANSEWIRERVQNFWIHKPRGVPYFKNLGGPWKQYGGIYSSNPFTTW